MTRKKYIKATLIACMVFLAIGGWVLHSRIHSPMADADNYIPYLSGLFSILILPFMFWFSRTLVWAYLINGFLIIIATITMGHFSIVHFSGPLTLYNLVYGTLVADIALAWGKFFAGKAVFDLEILRAETDPMPKGRWFRWPNTGFWLVHLVLLGAIYALGNILWR